MSDVDGSLIEIQKFMFKLVWPKRKGVKHQTWVQSKRPQDSPGGVNGGGVEGYEPIDVRFNGANWGGLRLSDAGNQDSLLDGSIDFEDHANRYYHIGCHDSTKMRGPPKRTHGQPTFPEDRRVLTTAGLEALGNTYGQEAGAQGSAGEGHSGLRARAL